MKRHWYIDEIKHAVSHADACDVDLLRDAVAAYSEACHGANERLSRVAGLIDRGLRSEAIEDAERGDPLLEDVAALDGARGDGWDELFRAREIAAPPRIDVFSAETLNTGYATLAELGPLLEKHRILAAARAPLAARLTVLRQLRRRDPESPAWLEDIESYERHRLEEIEREANVAVKQGDAEAVRQIASEIGQTEWEVPVPPELRSRVASILQNFDASQSVAILEDLIEPIEAAYGELDYEAIMPLVATWRQHAVIADMTPDSPACQRVEPALQWADEQAAEQRKQAGFASAVSALEGKLARDANTAELDQAYHAALQYGEPIPELLSERVTTRLTSLEQMRRRRVALVAGVSTLAMLLVATGAGALWWRSAARHDRLRSAEALEQLLQDRSYDAAERFVEELPPPLRESPELRPLVSRLTEQSAEEKRRRADFTERLGEAQSMDLDNPPRGILQRLQKLAKTESERREVDKVREAIGARQAERQRQQESELAERMRAWATRVSDTEASLRRGERLTREREIELLDDIREEFDAFPGVSVAFRSQADALVERAQRLVQTHRMRQQQSQALDEVFDALGNPALYAKRLERFAANNPKSVEAEVFIEIARDRRWKAVDAWNRFWDDHGRRLTALSPTEAATLLEEGRSLTPTEEDRPCPLDADFQRRKPQLEKIAERLETVEKLRTWLHEPLFFNTWAVCDKDGDVLYSSTDPVISANGFVAYTELTDFGEARRRTTLNPRWRGLPAHVALSRETDASLGDALRGEWFKGFSTAALAVIRAHSSGSDDDQPPLDPLVGLDLLRRILVAGAEGSVAFEEATQSIRDRVRDTPIDFTAPWYAAGNARADAARREAIAVFPDEETFRGRVRNANASYRFHARGPDRYVWVGAVDATDPGSPSVRTRDSIPGSGSLVVIDATEPEFRPVASVRNGRIASQRLSGRPTGTPVFLRVSPETAE